MQCPVCKSEHLVRSERSGVAQDYCPRCRAWVDEMQEREGDDFDPARKTDTRPPVPQDPKNRQS